MAAERKRENEENGCLAVPDVYEEELTFYTETVRAISNHCDGF
jgi:hypothetical protein